MARTITDIKQQCVSTYLGFPLEVNFGTAANNYNDADDVGRVANRCYDDVVEKALRMYPWSFCREDGIITGTKVSNPSVERFMYYATIPFSKYVCMQAVFYDPKHWSKCFEWKQYGTTTIKFNLPKIYVEYTVDVDPQYYPAYFADYVACALAVECCAPLRLESKLPILLQQLQAIFLDARKQDSMGEPAPASFDNIIDEARNAL